MFDKLSDKLQNIVKNISGNSHLTEANMSEMLRQIRLALLESDVSISTVKEFIRSIKEKALGQNILTTISAGDLLVKIVKDELCVILGKENAPLNITNSQVNIIMMLGLQGSGKTTTSAKLALKLKNDKKKVLLIAADVYRPAAIDQLKILGEKIGVDVFSIEGQKDVLKIVEEGIERAKVDKFDIVIIDTAGRLQIDSDMMAELMLIDRSYEIHEKLLVIDSMSGQEVLNVAKDFDAQLDLSGFVLTKLDSDTSAGVALSLAYTIKKPIKLTGIGEKIEDLEEFYPERIASRILGMGDIVSLVEKAQKVFDEKKTKDLQLQLEKGNFTFNDFLKMKKMMSSFGSLGNILSLLPIPNLDKDTKDKISFESEKQFKKFEVMISSMTVQERNNPDILNHSRKKRIAKGSGVDLVHLNAFIVQFEQMRKMMSGFTKMKRKKKHQLSSMAKNMFK